MPMQLQITLFLLLVFGLAFLAVKFPHRKVVKLGKNEGYGEIMLPNLFLILLVAAAFVIVSGYRGYAFADTGSYTYYYRDYLSDSFSSAWKDASESKAFWAVAALIKSISGSDMTWFLIIYAILTIVPVMLVFYRHSESIEISVFLYVTMGTYLVTMNAMRQCAAAAIMFCGYRFFIKKRWIPFLVLVFIAFFFHATTIVMIPIFIFAHRKPWSTFITAVAAGIILLLAFVPSASNFVFGLLGETKYSQYESMQGASIGRALTMLVVCYIAFRNRHRIAEMYPQSNPLVNVLIIHTIMLFAATNSWIFARITVYTDLYVQMIVPYIIYASFKKGERGIYVTTLLIFFLAYHLYEYRNVHYYSKFLGINY